MTPRVVIVGAGLSGLVAARDLVGRNIEVVLVDKGRRIGGRFCTRRVELPDGRVASFDLGPQLLTRVLDVGSPTTLHHAPWRWFDPGVEIAWGYLNVTDVQENDPPHRPRHLGGNLAIAGGMRELPFSIAAGLGGRVRLHDYTRVERLERSAGNWRVHLRSLRDDSVTTEPAHVVVLTAPLPQSLELLASSGIELPEETLLKWREVRYQRCVALYGVFNVGNLRLPPGGMRFDGSGPLLWVTDNSLKTVSAAASRSTEETSWQGWTASAGSDPPLTVSKVPGSITALTTPEWTEAHWDLSDDELIRHLLPVLWPYVGEPSSMLAPAVQRWRWAWPVNPLPQQSGLLRDLNLVLAGDGFSAGVPPASAAVRSGRAAARQALDLVSVLARRDGSLQLSTPTRITLTAVVSSPAHVWAAVTARADQLELAVAPEWGGLTPSRALFEWACAVAGNLPVYVVLRPRPGGFTYSDDEFRLICRDAWEFLRAGANGLVFACLHAGGIDRERCATLVEMARAANARAVFSRAFDLLPNPYQALEELTELGFDAVQTSGCHPTAHYGTARIASLVRHAGWGIEVIVTGNICPSHLAELVRSTRCSHVRIDSRCTVSDPLLRQHVRLAPVFGAGKDGTWAGTDTTAIARVRAILDELGAVKSGSSTDADLS